MQLLRQVFLTRTVPVRTPPALHRLTTLCVVVPIHKIQHRLSALALALGVEDQGNDKSGIYVRMEFRLPR
jgi:mRNA-degrading endonuclease toxin of MazEF toxin-antitoxin module